MKGDDFTEIIHAEYGAVETKVPPLNAQFLRADGTVIAQLCINQDGLLDVIGHPDDFTEAAEIFAEALMTAWQARMTGRGNHGPAT